MSGLLTAAAAAGPLVAAWSAHTVFMRRRLEAARRDPLTGLHTRHAFEKRAARMLGQGPCAVVVIDLDGFKQVNDTFGHAAGDTAIRESGAWLNEWLTVHSPGTGMAARLGGDEFALVVPAADPVTLRSALATLHEWMRVPIDHQGQRLCVGASIGACVVAGNPAPKLPVLLRRADEAMYSAKQNGGGVHVTGQLAPEHASVNGRRDGRDGAHHRASSSSG